jgi:hypothetical protein
MHLEFVGAQSPGLPRGFIAPCANAAPVKARRTAGAPMDVGLLLRKLQSPAGCCRVATMRLTKEHSRERWNELRDLVIAWKPNGLIAIGSPRDEYDCLLGPLMRDLEQGAAES